MMRKMGISLVLSALATMAIGCASSGGSGDGLRVEGGAPVVYENDLGEQVVARYYQLSDGSLNFVKVTLPGGVEWTLPQVVSASGARFTDDRMLVWLTRGETAFIEVRDDDGQWRRLDDELRVVAQD